MKINLYLEIYMISSGDRFSDYKIDIHNGNLSNYSLVKTGMVDK